MKSFKVNRSRLHSLFRNMVDIYSPSGKEEELTEWLVQYIASAGKGSLNVGKEQVDNTRSNIIVSRGSSSPRFLFLGHIDTVPAFDIDSYGFREQGDNCRGLGTADMKSGCAALIEAFTALSESGKLTENASLALVVGEEENGDGTKALLENHDFECVLIAEPTGLSPCTEHYSYVEMILRTYGFRQHAAVAERDNNAVRRMLNFLLDLERHIEPDMNTILNIRDIHSSDSGFAVPDQCVAALDFHFPPSTDAAQYSGKIAGFASTWFSDFSSMKYDLDFPTVADGYRIGKSEKPLPQIESAFSSLGISWETASFRSHSDANLFSQKGLKPVILGPGSLSMAHTADESVSFSEVLKAAEIYCEILLAAEKK